MDSLFYEQMKKQEEWTYQSIQLRIGKKNIMAYFNESLTGGQIAHSPRMHLHPAPYYEIILFRQGVTRIITDHREITVQPGSVALVPPNMNHRLKMADDISDPLQAPTCATFMLVPDGRSASDADGRLAEALFDKITDIVILENMEYAFHYIDETTMELYRVQTGYIQVASNELENFFICLLRSFGEIPGNTRPPIAAVTDKNRTLIKIAPHTFTGANNFFQIIRIAFIAYINSIICIYYKHIFQMIYQHKLLITFILTPIDDILKE